MQSQTRTSFTDKQTLLSKIDSLPSPGPAFQCQTITIAGDILDAGGQPMVEELEIFYRDPVECVHELLSNPAFPSALHYAPVQVYEDATCTEQIFNEMWTGQWWWDTQVHTISHAGIQIMTADIIVTGTCATWPHDCPYHPGIRQDPAFTIQWR